MPMQFDSLASMSNREKLRTYPLSMAEASVLSGLNPRQIRDFASAGMVTVLLENGPGGPEWFNADDVRDLQKQVATITDQEMDMRRVHDLGEALRAYMAQFPPLVDYDAALETDSPVLGRAKSGSIYAHVQPESIANFAGANCPTLPSAWTPIAVRKSLELIGAVRMRGLRPIGGGEQRWQVWYRLPLTYWASTIEVQNLISSLGGAREH